MRACATAFVTLVGLAPLNAQVAHWPTRGWPVAQAEAVGLNPAPLRALHDRIAAGEFGSIDRLVITRRGQMVFNERYARDYRTISRGHRGALGCGWESCPDSAALHQFNYYHPDHHPWYKGRDIHTLQSVTKSVTATLIGIALGRGEIRSLDTTLLSYLGDYNLARVDQRLRRATLADLLTMRTGIEWHEQDRPLDSTNTTLQLEFSPDWVQFTLDQPMDADPGAKWVYNSGGSHLMSAVIRKATGLTADRYAERYLFGPLGIREYHWKIVSPGLPDTEGGLYLEAEQLAKIGYLYLRDGMWEGKRILPDGWVAAATSRKVNSVNQAGFGYGYQWWRADRGEVVVWAGLGFGGQLLLVLPQHDIVAVANAWNLFERRPGLQGPLLTALIDATR